MIELKTGDLWDYRNMGYYVCINTNGSVKADGSAVMGKGCAYEAFTQYPYFAPLLGDLLELYGNHVFYLGQRVFSFPTKNNWQYKSEMQIIERSAFELKEIMKRHPSKQVVIPRPGCGYGRLVWSDVQQVLASILNSDQYIIVSKNS